MKRCEELQLGCFGRPQRTPPEGLLCLWGAIGAIWVRRNAHTASVAPPLGWPEHGQARETKRKSGQDKT